MATAEASFWLAETGSHRTAGFSGLQTRKKEANELREAGKVSPSGSEALREWRPPDCEAERALKGAAEGKRGRPDRRSRNPPASASPSHHERALPQWEASWRPGPPHNPAWLSPLWGGVARLPASSVRQSAGAKQQRAESALLFVFAWFTVKKNIVWKPRRSVLLLPAEERVVAWSRTPGIFHTRWPAQPRVGLRLSWVECGMLLHDLNCFYSTLKMQSRLHILREQCNSNIERFF